MRKQRILFPAVVAILTGFGMMAAHAAPYVEKIRTLQGPAGETLFLEKLYATDAWMMSNPVSVQLRNQSGTVLAFAPVAADAAVVCSSVRRCLVFPHDTFAWFSRGWRLDADRIDFKAVPSGAADQTDRLRDDEVDYKSYLTYDTVTEFHNAALGDPRKRLSAQGFAPTGSALWGVASAGIIFFDSLLFWPVLIAALVGLWMKRVALGRAIRRGLARVR